MSLFENLKYLCKEKEMDKSEKYNIFIRAFQKKLLFIVFY